MQKITTPRLPSNVGKRRKITSIDGKKREFTLVDEVAQVQSTDRQKVIYLQKIRFEDNGNVEIRLAYYIIGRKGKMIGRWVWGQFAPTMPAKDLKAIVGKAVEKGIL